MDILIKPEKFELIEQKEELNYNYARYELYPLEKGYAITIGNALRRVLLSSVPSLAITGMRIPGQLHEFDVAEGIKEDLLEVTLNLKKVQIKIDDLKNLSKITDTIPLTITKKGPGEIKAGDIQTPAGIEIANPEFTIAHFNSEKTIEIELFAEVGKGFIPSSELDHPTDVEYIFIDGVFSPVTKVNFLTENIRVGKRTDYDKLILDIWTKKNITPEEALKEATAILMEHFIFIAKLWKDTSIVEALEPVQDMGGAADESDKDDSEQNMFGLSSEIIETPIDNLDLTKRAKNCLKRERINTVGELFKKTPEELMKIKNFGRKSLDEIKKELEDKFQIDYEKLYEEERRSSN
ncbi:DNA-directed RNA polymerase subunit alpha [Oceanotoga sp. DSM 15011]|jgi:DNA-directed RNA polymerase subunit alpha|uniref:DNA-directed RNA polymerase subunit alpha n=1 Tax=Oceanotoga teriensis TaxID=515440 RepID=A0AA45HIG7_9BACT|nr:MULTISPECIES: DNA-directed RNA polymerase subunit alpha [Oceanotoga]MDN5343333.1 DNA-directed polymerase subunit alpha [Oceanotoga sp.]MDO7975620.1 DNA-directed RNA polymerase subunit alpha [Oceanotoga teriensis]PWJ90631.1 DNA-directed RNA polymerase subunit alpha [Oceanotoga teriensis]UYO99874.1 DNA-directed RNA polymerase subunit alpha [Oceanotoga sp. DSM 15011]